jgi:hypothetical protein
MADTVTNGARPPPAVFACIAALGTIPAALLIGRYCRSDPKWCRYHIILNSITTFLIVLVFGLGMGAVASQDLGTQFNGPYSDLHHKGGLGAFSLPSLGIENAESQISTYHKAAQ